VKRILVCLALFLSACVSSPIPDNYSGPIATIRDTAVSETSSRAQFFYLSEIDGRKIDNVFSASKRANHGRGFLMGTVEHARDVPARASTFTLEGRVSYGAPIAEMLNSSTMYTVQKTLKFAPQSNKTYVVKGTLSEERKEIWLEDAASGTRID